ncbi:SAM hydroxide adenosyltransferase [Actomonas aquatica]|uniref:SAM hydroxide adenosyltransferase n=1 Tax=Actomonas aquatica TaxID=2866162 RepID=A0ABZ1C6T3_9BACT|nr:SAM hydroxide adenosyltransferase [Opitutus sp. WL0086]WRQ87166.1 SAM hydroxide adenosyltransferase [Opitutus sp. WL0086]
MRRPALSFTALLLGLLVLPRLIAAPATTVLTGEIEGAKYTIAAPAARADWNGNLLLIAHGYRPETAPLVADLNPAQAAYATLLAEGWIVAKTSYRRNGIIVQDAITDLANLHAHIRAQFGPPSRSIVMGDSMGGTIATLLAESESPPYDGLIAIGAALDLREDNGAGAVNLQPRHPLLFIANRSEFEGPSAYTETVLQRPTSVALTAPALFRVDRDGHVNVNQAERLYAIRAMELWLEHGSRALPDDAQTPASPHDGTVQPVARDSAVTFDADGRGFTATVTDVSAIYGNVWLNAQPADFAAIGLTSGLWARLTAGDETYRVRHGTDFSDVERGQWVVFPNADGFYWLSRNWANAAETANLQLGDTVHIRRFDTAEKN